jgi:hypothetical protein
MHILDAVERFLYRSKRSSLIAVTLAVSFVKTGVWYMPNFDGWKSMRLDPFHNPFAAPDQHYLFWNWLGPFLAWRLHIHNGQSFLYYHLIFSLGFTATFLWYVFANFSERDARTALILFLAIPASATAYFWIGMDSITLALILFVLVLRNRPWMALLMGVLLGMQHAEQGIFAFGALLVALVWSSLLKDKSEFAVRWAACSLAGVILGKLALILIFRHYGIQVNSGRPYYLRHYAGMYAEMFYYHFQYVLWSILGAGWIAVAKFTERGRQAIPFLAALLGLMLLLPVVGDETRVLAIISFPLVAVYLILNRDFLRSLDNRFACWIFGIWLLVPWPWAWGRPLVSIFPYDVAYLLHRWFGWFNVPQNQPMWPLIN